MKITVIGGGGVRSMFLAKSLVEHRHRYGITEIYFMDDDKEKLEIYGKMAAQTARGLDPSIRFTITTDANDAVRDADYIITTIRVGGDDMRIQDERLALAKGVLGQETTGAAGFSFAMRSIPALAGYCELAKKIAKPNVKIFNFTNPAGVVSQTLRDMGYDFTYGICDAPSGLLHGIAKIYQVEAEAVTAECYGCNHFSFMNSVKINGKDIMPELLERKELYQETDMRFFDKDLVKHVGCLLNEYLYYYYYREEAIKNITDAEVTRGEMIRDINRQMTAELEQMDIEHDFENCLKVFEKWYGKREAAYMANETGIRRDLKPYRFDLHKKSAGGYAGVALKYMEAEQTHMPVEMILCVPNQGAIEGLEDSDVVEISATITADGYTPHKVQPSPVQLELIRRVKAYERMASLAIRTKSVSVAIDCLQLHPLVNSYSLAKQLAAEYIQLNQAYSKGWK